jgi:hypothetical protein
VIKIILEQIKTWIYVLNVCINTLYFDWSENAEHYTGKTKRVMLRELGSETNDRAARGRERF